MYSIYIRDSDNKMLRDRCEYLIRGGRIYEPEEYAAHFEDASDLTAELDRVGKRFQDELLRQRKQPTQ